jgi:2-C-methyl-D-erythritol 4-phosphate cytidylyltransferase/2-C-methyl-D-erythritol 2,4-cyclodiphosphate synthase
MIAAIIAAGGSGERFGAAIPKALIQLGDRTLLEHSISALSSVADEIVVSAPAGYEDQVRALVGTEITVVTGGATRSESVRLGLAVISGADFVLVHDAARALASRELAARVVAALKAGDVAVIPALPEVDTVKVIDAHGYVSSTPDRTSLRRVQTPQGFTYSVLKKAHEASGDATDDAALVADAGHKVRVIDGEE